MSRMRAASYSATSTRNAVASRSPRGISARASSPRARVALGLAENVHEGRRSRWHCHIPVTIEAQSVSLRGMASQLVPLFSMTHLPERHHGLRPHHLIHRHRSQKQKSGGDHDTNIGGEPRQDRAQRVTHGCHCSRSQILFRQPSLDVVLPSHEISRFTGDYAFVDNDCSKPAGWFSRLSVVARVQTSTDLNRLRTFG